MKTYTMSVSPDLVRDINPRVIPAFMMGVTKQLTDRAMQHASHMMQLRWTSSLIRGDLTRNEPDWYRVRVDVLPFA